MYLHRHNYLLVAEEQDTPEAREARKKAKMAALLAKMQAQAADLKMTVATTPGAAPATPSVSIGAMSLSKTSDVAAQRAYLGYNAADENVADPEEEQDIPIDGPVPAYAQAIFAAAKRGDFDAVKDQLATAGANASLDLPLGPRGTTALMAACEHPNGGRVVDALLKAKASPNPLDAAGRTALIRACACENASAVNDLLRAGADAGVVDRSGWSALMYANHAGQGTIAGKIVRALAKGPIDTPALAPVVVASK